MNIIRDIYSDVGNFLFPCIPSYEEMVEEAAELRLNRDITCDAPANAKIVIPYVLREAKKGNSHVKICLVDKDLFLFEDESILELLEQCTVTLYLLEDNQPEKTKRLEGVMESFPRSEVVRIQKDTRTTSFIVAGNICFWRGISSGRFERDFKRKVNFNHKDMVDILTMQIR